MARKISRPARRPRQLGLEFRTWGGARKGAGRKPQGERAGVPHRPRTALSRRWPLHVTLRVVENVWNLRSRRSLRVIERALHRGADRFDVQVVQFSLQGNHIHLLVEAADHVALGQALKGLSVRIAKGMNRMMKRTGQVIGDRYHARILRTPTEVRRVVSYIKDNYRHHRGQAGERLPADWVDPYCSHAPALAVTLPRPSTWLLRVGARRGPSRGGASASG